MNEEGTILVTTDSVCDLPDELLQTLSIAVCPYYVKTSGGKFLDGSELDSEELLEYMEKGWNAASEAPEPAQYQRFFRKLRKEGRQIF